jgi:signal transduction histidine kinase
MVNEPVEILIVDDEARNLDVLEVMLASSGCTLVRANSADEALLAMLRHEFAAMILDIRMPGMSGIELANLVKQRRRTQDVPILFLTAHLVDQDDVLRGYGVGAVDYLSKPINADILRSKVAVFVELYRKTRALATLNEALQREVAEREKAQAALEQVNQELELRVAERTAALSLARDEAERQSRLKDEFLATLSHELRTPMNAILGWLSMLGKGAIVKDPEHAMTVIQRNAQLQSKLIEDLLDMNTLTSGTVRLDFAPVDVGTAVESAIQTLKPTADTKGVNLSVAIEPGLSHVPADGRRLQQILWNLIHNAVKFTGAGGSIEVSVTHADAHVGILVKDSGKGISSDFLPYVFDRFRQADSSTTRAAWGLGIGLSIAKHLVELHGGTVEASSPGPGRGASFLVKLPLMSQEPRRRPAAASRATIA